MEHRYLNLLLPALQEVKQGDVLSPSLFNIYVNDVSTMFRNNCEPVKLGTRYINHLLYADDMVINLFTWITKLC